MCKLADAREGGSSPESHTLFVQCGQVGAKWGPADVSLRPTLPRTREDEIIRNKDTTSGGQEGNKTPQATTNTRVYANKEACPH